VTAVQAGVRHHVGPVDDFELRTFRLFTLAGRPVGVVRTEHGFFAVRNRCPHQGADICAGRVSGTMLPSDPQEYRYSEDTLVVVCPWHRWEFELDSGHSVGQVTRKRLVTYPVEVVDGEVHVILKAAR
jgi:nitrite reductase/ring-hydroxylating ferredoxin subunit